MALAAVGALEVGHVLHEAQQLDVHVVREVHGLAHDHGHQLLRSGYRDNAVNRQRLEHGEQHVGGSRRHVDEQVVDLAPVRLAVELTDGVRDDRAAPGHRDVVFRQHEVGGHHLDAALRLAGQDAVGVGGQRVRDAEGLRDGRSGDVGVQDAHVLPALLHFAGKQAGDQRLAHAALAGHDADDVFDVGAGVRLDGAGALGGAVAASGLAAAAALVRAFFCHDSFFLGFQRPRAAGAPLVSPG